MRALFLDDMKSRHISFESKFGSKYDVMHVYNYLDCITALKTGSFGIVFLDHDLSEKAILCDPDDIDELTGTDVAVWIVQNMDPKTAPGFICHSLNPAGRKRMVALLVDAGFDAAECDFLTLMTK